MQKQNTEEKNMVNASTNAAQHGIYCAQFLSHDEKMLFEQIIDSINQDFVLNGSSDRMQAKTVAMTFVQIGRALEADDTEALERLDRILRSNLKDLKMTKMTRESEASGKFDTTPAEWATALIEKLRTQEKKQEDQETPIEAQNE